MSQKLKIFHTTMLQKPPKMQKKREKTMKIAERNAKKNLKMQKNGEILMQIISKSANKPQKVQINFYCQVLTSLIIRFVKMKIILLLMLYPALCLFPMLMWKNHNFCFFQSFFTKGQWKMHQFFATVAFD